MRLEAQKESLPDVPRGSVGRLLAGRKGEGKGSKGTAARLDPRGSVGRLPLAVSILLSFYPKQDV